MGLAGVGMSTHTRTTDQDWTSRLITPTYALDTYAHAHSYMFRSTTHEQRMGWGFQVLWLMRPQVTWQVYAYGALWLLLSGRRVGACQQIQLYL